MIILNLKKSKIKGLAKTDNETSILWNLTFTEDSDLIDHLTLLPDQTSSIIFKKCAFSNNFDTLFHVINPNLKFEHCEISNE